jgi:hypothetical protein
MKNGKNTDEDNALDGEIITPEDIERETYDGRTAQEHRASKVKLVTAGNVKTEMAKVYREMRGGKITGPEGDRLIKALALILKAVDLELTHSLSQEDPDDDTPALAGLRVIGPPSASQGPSRRKRLNSEGGDGEEKG